MGLTPVARSYRQYSKHNCKLLCERDISRLTPVKKMRLSIPKTDSVNVAIVTAMLQCVRDLDIYSFVL